MPDGHKIYGDTVLFGIHVAFVADDRDILNAILERYPRDERDFAQHGTLVYIVLSTYDVKKRPYNIFHVKGPMLHIVDDRIRSEADGAEGKGSCYFPRELRDSEAVADAINTVVLFLVAHAGRTPVHASALMLGDTAVVLAGKSGMGKSSLALAANRAGLPILSDDTVFVQTAPRLRVWALAQAIHVFEKDAPPGAQGGMRFRSGRWKKALPIALPRRVADRAMLCMLSRGDRVSIAPMYPEDAVSALTFAPEPGYQFYGDRAAAAIGALAAGGCWRLTLSHNPDDAIAVLRDLDAICQDRMQA